MTTTILGILLNALATVIGTAIGIYLACLWVLRRMRRREGGVL